MITETNIKCFLSLAETLSFTKSAADLFMTQQAVSKSISNLEETLGFPLFLREHHGVSLTTGGERFYTLFEGFVKKYNSTVDSVRQYYNGANKSLEIGYQPWLNFGEATDKAFTALRESIPDFLLNIERHPPLTLCKLFQDGKLDMLVMYERFLPEMAGTRRRKLFETPIIIMVSKNHRSVGPNATYRDFTQEPFIFDALEKESIAKTTARAKYEATLRGLQPQQIIIKPNRGSAYAAAELGQGVILASELTSMTNSSSLRKFPIGQTESVACIWRDSDKTAVIEKYIENFSRECRKLKKT